MLSPAWRARPPSITRHSQQPRAPARATPVLADAPFATATSPSLVGSQGLRLPLSRLVRRRTAAPVALSFSWGRRLFGGRAVVLLFAISGRRMRQRRRRVGLLGARCARR